MARRRARRRRSRRSRRATTPADSPTIEPSGYQAPADDGLGVEPGKIKHVWLIVLENKAYDASLTGLNDDSYVSQTLPSQGALLTNYYGTGHSSLDNYVSLFSGQAPVTDDQADCPAYDLLDGTVDMSGSLATNPDYGQFVSAAGVDAPAGDNGCVYPQRADGVQPARRERTSAGSSTRRILATPTPAAPHTRRRHAVLRSPRRDRRPRRRRQRRQREQYPNPSSANATDQYVAKHNPLPWFESTLLRLLQGLDSNGATPTISRRCSARTTGCTPICRTQDHARVQRDRPEQLLQRSRRRLRGQQPLRRLWRPNGQIPNSPVNYTGGAVRRGPVPRAHHPRDRGRRRRSRRMA